MKSNRDRFNSKRWPDANYFFLKHVALDAKENFKYPFTVRYPPSLNLSNYLPTYPHSPKLHVPMLSLFILAISVSPLVYAQGCSNPLSTSYQTPLLAPGYSLQLLTKNITNPRHIVFDSAGNLLVAGDPTGIIALAIDGLDSDRCITIREQKLIVENNDLQLKHGISLSADGKTLYGLSPIVYLPIFDTFADPGPGRMQVCELPGSSILLDLRSIHHICFR